MPYSLERLPKNQVKFTLTIPHADIQAGMEHAAHHIQENRSFPGFRPGQAPTSIVRQQVGEAALLEHAIEELLPAALEEALTKEQLTSVGHPFYTPVTMSADEDCVFTAEISLMPEITKVADFSKITLSAANHDVSDAEMQTAKQDLLRMKTKETAITLDRPLKDTDKAIIDLTMKENGVEIEGGSAKGHAIYLQEPYYLPGFTEALIGSAIGEERTFSITVPEDHENPRLKGKTLDITTTLRSIEEITVPEWDDAFAALLGIKDIATLEEKLRENLKAEKVENEAMRQEKELLEAIANASTYEEFSDALINQEVEKMMQELQAWVEERGLDFAQYQKTIGKSLAEMKLDFTPQAIMRLKVALLLERVAKDANLLPKPEEIEAEVARMAAGVQGNEEALAYVHSPAFMGRIAAQKRNRLAIDHLKTLVRT